MPGKHSPNKSYNRDIQYPQYGSNFVPATAQGAEAYSRTSGNYSVGSRKKMSTKKIAIIVICSVLVVLIGAGTAFALYMNYLNDRLHGSYSQDEMLAISDALGDYGSLNDTFYMMLIGTDGRQANSSLGSRSDTNVVVRIDPKEHVVTLLSIPRDTKIDIPKHGTQKFNAAYAFDGPAGTIKAAEELLDIDITHYAEVNFTELANLVNAVGGITVENESKIDNWKCDDGDGNHYIIEKGVVHLNGGEALTFARNRDYADGDFTRQKHQRAVIEAIGESVMDAPLTQIPSIIEAAVSCVTTDLNVMDIIGLAQNFAEAEEVIMYSCMLPSYTQMINGISFVINDTAKTEEMLAVFVAGGDPGEYVSNIGSAPAISDKTVDTSNVLIYDTDEEAVSGSAPATATNTSSSSGGTSSGGSPSSGSTNSSSSGQTNTSSSSNTSTSGGSTGGETGGSGDPDPGGDAGSDD